MKSLNDLYHPGGKKVSLYRGEQTSELTFWKKMLQVDPFGLLPTLRDLITMMKQGTSVKSVNTNYSYLLSTWCLSQNIPSIEPESFKNLHEKYGWYITNSDHLEKWLSKNDLLPRFCEKLCEEALHPIFADFYVYNRPYKPKHEPEYRIAFENEDMIQRFKWHHSTVYTDTAPGFHLIEEMRLSTKDKDDQRLRFDWLGFTKKEITVAEDLQKEGCLKMHRFLQLVLVAKLTIRNKVQLFFPHQHYLTDEHLSFFYKHTKLHTNEDNRLSVLYSNYVVYSPGPEDSAPKSEEEASDYYLPNANCTTFDASAAVRAL